jgi:hypothetical protein
MSIDRGICHIPQTVDRLIVAEVTQRMLLD